MLLSLIMPKRLRNIETNLRINFKVVEPAFSASVVATPSKGVNQNAEIRFTAIIQRQSTSRLTAFNVLLLLAVPFPHLSPTEHTFQAGTLRTVPGHLSPVQFLR